MDVSRYKHVLLQDQILELSLKAIGEDHSDFFVCGSELTGRSVHRTQEVNEDEGDKKGGAQEDRGEVQKENREGEGEEKRREEEAREEDKEVETGDIKILRGKGTASDNMLRALMSNIIRELKTVSPEHNRQILFRDVSEIMECLILAKADNGESINIFNGPLAICDNWMDELLSRGQLTHEARMGLFKYMSSLLGDMICLNHGDWTLDACLIDAVSEALCFRWGGHDVGVDYFVDWLQGQKNTGDSCIAGRTHQWPSYEELHAAHAQNTDGSGSLENESGS